MKRLAEFFFEAQAVRWKVYGLSGAVAFVYSFTSLFIFHKEERRVGAESAVVLFALILLSIGVYVFQVKIFGEWRESKPKAFGLRLATAGGLAAVFIAFSYYAGIPRIQATIVNLRLEWLTTHPTVYAAYRPPDQQVQIRLRAINSIVETSSLNQIPVDPRLLVQAQTVLSNELKAAEVSAETKQAGWTAAIDLQSFTYTRMAQTGAITAVTPREIFNGPSYFFNSLVSIDSKTLYIKGDHSVFTMAPGGDGQFVIDQSTVVFDSIDFVGWMSQDIFTVIGDRSNLFIRDSIIRNAVQDLDRITWVDVRFENSRILYRGGPLRLRNVVFKNCDLSNLEMGLRRLLKNPESVTAITESSGQPVTFVYEP